MNLESFAKIYAPRVQYEIIREVSNLLVPVSGDIPILPVQFRPWLFRASLLYNSKSKDYSSIVLQIPKMKVENKRDYLVSDEEQAKFELLLCHESAHYVHAKINQPETLRWRKSCEEFDRNKIRPVCHDTLLVSHEITAEFLAFWYIDRKQGIENFLVRLDDEEKKPDGMYDKIQTVFLNTSRDKRDDLARKLLVYPAEKIEEMTEFTHIFGNEKPHHLYCQQTFSFW